MEERRHMKCQVLNTLASIVENSFPRMITFAHTVEKLILLDHYGVRNAATPLKQDKSDVATVACHFR